MNSFIEKLKQFFTNSTSKNDLKDLFVCFNSKKGLDKIGRLLDKSWNSFDSDGDIYVDSTKMLRKITDEIVEKNTVAADIKLTQSITCDAKLMFVQEISFYSFFFNKNNYSLLMPLLNIGKICVATESGKVELFCRQNRPSIGAMVPDKKEACNLSENVACISHCDDLSYLLNDKILIFKNDLTKFSLINRKVGITPILKLQMKKCCITLIFSVVLKI